MDPIRRKWREFSVHRPLLSVCHLPSLQARQDRENDHLSGHSTFLNQSWTMTLFRRREDADLPTRSIPAAVLWLLASIIFFSNNIVAHRQSDTLLQKSLTTRRQSHV